MFPALSVTVHVTEVLPRGNVLGALFDIVVVEQLSLTIGLPNKTPVATQAELALTETEAGAVMIGFELSCTLTVAVQVCMFPLLSVTVRVTVFEPILEQLKLFGTTVMDAIPQLSDEPLFI